MKNYHATYCAAFVLLLASIGVSMRGRITDPQTHFNATNEDDVYKQLIAKLPKSGDKANIARAELKYWHQRKSWSSFKCQPVVIKDRIAAEVMLLRTRAGGMPGYDFSMAILLINHRVVDWVSCWTYNRTANQQLQLEDLDGDGAVDVGFRASKGWFGLRDKRQHTLSGVDGIWLYAYAITKDGFKSFFPINDRWVKVHHTFDTAHQPVTLKVTGSPDRIQENHEAQCTIVITNTSAKDDFVLPIPRWFEMISEEAGGSGYRLSDKPVVLRPGESDSRVVSFSVWDVKSHVNIHWRFLPKGIDPSKPYEEK